MVGDMDAQGSCSAKLGEGVRVEVRQKERGLRGSWHAGTIVELKAGGRLVEYDELLSEDGLGKLRESIPSPPQLLMQSRKRGILRPIPPVLTSISPFSLKGGVYVDVLFQDAWWEAVLLDDIVSSEENAYVNVIYPDEGDLARVPVKDLRISQLWDDVTGEWNLKGSCNLSRFLKRRGIARHETVATTSHQASFVQRKSKCCDRVCPFLGAERPGGNATTSALLLDMTHYVQGAARAAELGEDCSRGTESSDQQLGSDQSSNAQSISQEPPQSTCLESGRVDMPSFASQSSNLAEVTGFFYRNEVAAFEGPECLKCTNYDAKACIDSSQSKDFGKAVFEKDAMEQHITSHLAKKKASDGVESRRSDTEVYMSPCEEAGESLVSPPSLPSISSQGDGYKDPREKQEDSSSNNASPCEKQAYSSVVPPSLPSPSPQGEFSALFCGNETDMVVSTPSQEEDHLHLVCESKQQQCFSLPGELIDGTNVHLSTSNSQDLLDSTCEEKQHKRAVSMGQCLERGVASSKSNIHKMAQVDMDAGKSIRLSTPSQTDSDQKPVEANKLNYLEEGAWSCMDRVCSGGQSSIKEITEVTESNVVSDNEKLDHEKEIPLVKAQVDCRAKRKAKFVPQEMKMRTGLRDKHQSHGSLSDDQTEKRLETDTLRSFRDRLMRQKQAGAVKRKALETSRGSEKVEKIEKKDVDLQLVSNLNHTETVSKSSLKAPTVRDKSLRFLTRDIAKKALLEAGYTIDLRPRRSRAYEDAVYVSPEGHSHWSLPKAWEALKKSQAEKRLASDEQRCSRNAGHEKGAMSLTHGEEGRQSLAKADESALKQVFSRFGNDERLQSALTKLGTCPRTQFEMAQDATRQAELTNADLTDILLGDLGILRRFTKKFLSENKLDSINSADSRKSRSLAAAFMDKKRKRDSAHALELSDRRLLDGRRKLQGDSFLKSREDKTQETARSFKQTTTEAKLTGSKHKAPSLFKSREDKIHGTARSLKPTATETKLTGLKHKTKNGKKPKARSGTRLEVRRSSSTGCEEPVCHSRRTIFAWMLDRGAVLEKERIFFMDPINNQVLKEGVVTREGILCSCCKRVYTVQSFEAHAGGHLGDWHKALVFTSGKRLPDCQLKAWDAEIHLRKAHNYIGVTEDDTNDDTCVLCGDGGDLICCDGCPSTFHASCLQIDNVPEGNWYCPKCSCGTCGGRQHDEEQKDPAVIVCNQCEHRYHIACLPGGYSIAGKEVFCGPSCEKVAVCGETDPVVTGLARQDPMKLQRLHDRLTLGNNRSKPSGSSVLLTLGNKASSISDSKGAVNVLMSSSQNYSTIKPEKADEAGMELINLFPPSLRVYIWIMEAADSYRLSVQMIWSLKSKICKLAEIPQHSRDSAEIGSLLTQRVLSLKALASLLGFLCFSPGVRSQSHGFEWEICRPDPPIDVMEVLDKAMARETVLLTLPWVLDYLQLIKVDRYAIALPYFQKALQALRNVYNYSILDPKNDSFGVPSMCILASLDRFFEFVNLPVFDGKAQQTMVEPGKLHGSDEDNGRTLEAQPCHGLDRIKGMVDASYIQQCCPNLMELRLLLTNGEDLLSNKNNPVNAKSLRKITPVHNPKSFQLSDQGSSFGLCDVSNLADNHIQVKLQQSFFEQRQELQRLVDFVVDTIAVNAARAASSRSVPPILEEALINLEATLAHKFESSASKEAESWQEIQVEAEVENIITSSIQKALFPAMDYAKKHTAERTSEALALLANPEESPFVLGIAGRIAADAAALAACKKTLANISCDIRKRITQELEGWRQRFQNAWKYNERAEKLQEQPLATGCVSKAANVAAGVRNIFVEDKENIEIPCNNSHKSVALKQSATCEVLGIDTYSTVVPLQTCALENEGRFLFERILCCCAAVVDCCTTDVVKMDNNRHLLRVKLAAISTSLEAILFSKYEQTPPGGFDSLIYADANSKDPFLISETGNGTDAFAVDSNEAAADDKFTIERGLAKRCVALALHLCLQSPFETFGYDPQVLEECMCFTAWNSEYLNRPDIMTEMKGVCHDLVNDDKCIALCKVIGKCIEPSTVTQSEKLADRTSECQSRIQVGGLMTGLLHMWESLVKCGICEANFLIAEFLSSWRWIQALHSEPWKASKLWFRAVKHGIANVLFKIVCMAQPSHRTENLVCACFEHLFTALFRPEPKQPRNAVTPDEGKKNMQNLRVVVVFIFLEILELKFLNKHILDANILHQDSATCNLIEIKAFIEACVTNVEAEE